MSHLDLSTNDQKDYDMFEKEVVKIALDYHSSNQIFDDFSNRDCRFVHMDCYLA